jgi:hypothetical protein
MNLPEPVQKPATRWPSVIGWGIFAAVAGLGCIVLPVFLFPGAVQHPAYGQPLISWFATAWANIRVVPTMASMFVLGAILGFAEPRWWPLSSCLTVSLPFLLNALNIVHDWAIDPTSHNLFPFEFAILMFFALPALTGGGLGTLIRWGIQRLISRRGG